MLTDSWMFGIIEPNTPIDRATINQIIADSGLFGLTVYINNAGNSVLEFYYYGKWTDTGALIQFEQSSSIVEQSAKRYGGKIKQTVHRAWFYAQPLIFESWGVGFTIPYTSVSSELYTTPKNQPNAVVVI